MNYAYDLAGDVTSWTHPAGFTLTNTYNAALQTTQITSSLNDSTHPGTLATMTYGPSGALKTLVNGCAGSGCTQVQETYDYNKRLQPVRIQLGTSASNAADYCLVYNYYAGVANPSTCTGTPGTISSGNNGNVMGYWYQDNVNPSLSHTASYAYDSVNRLLTTVATGSSTYNLTFLYDRYGNMTCTTNGNTNGPCGNYSFNVPSNQINTPGFTYDAAGNLTVDPSTYPTNTYQWDAEGRVTKVTQNGSTYSTTTYDAYGQAVEGVYPGYNVRVEGLFDAWGQELGYYSGTGNAWWDRDIRVAGRMIAQSYAGDTYFLHANHLGSDTQVTGHAGNVLTDFIYYPWENWTHAGSMVDAHFAGFQQSPGPNYGTPTRQYSGGLGRWLSPDPLGGDITNPQSLNRYAYAGNNPTTFVDPSGLNYTGMAGSLPHLTCLGMVCADNPSTYCGLPYCGDTSTYPGPDPFDLMLSTACPGGECTNYFDFNGATVANGLATLQPPHGTMVDDTGGPIFVQPPPGYCSALTKNQPGHFSFVSTNLLFAQGIALEVDTNPINILGLASLESNWGTSNLAVNYGNYFGLTKGPAYTGAIGTYRASSNYSFGVYPSPGFLNSGMSFANSFQGARVSGKWDPTGFVTALTTGPKAFNSEPAGGTPYLNRISSVDQFVSCVN